MSVYARSARREPGEGVGARRPGSGLLQEISSFPNLQTYPPLLSLPSNMPPPIIPVLKHSPYPPLFLLFQSSFPSFKHAPFPFSVLTFRPIQFLFLNILYYIIIFPPFTTFSQVYFLSVFFNCSKFFLIESYLKYFTFYLKTFPKFYSIAGCYKITQTPMGQLNKVASQTQNFFFKTIFQNLFCRTILASNTSPETGSLRYIFFENESFKIKIKIFCQGFK